MRWFSLVGIFLIFAVQFPNVTWARIEFGIAEYDGVKQCNKDAESLSATRCVFYYRLRHKNHLNLAELPQSFGITIAVKFPRNESNIHANILNGSYNDDLRALAALIKSKNRAVTLRILPEGNGFWNSDAAYAPGNSPDSYVKAYRFVADFFKRELGSQLEGLELNLNAASFDSKKKSLGVSDFSKFNPGPNYVNLVSFSVYNRCGTGPAFLKVRSFVEVVTPAYEAAAQFFPGVPVGIAELASSPYCSVDLLDWYTKAFISLINDFPRISSVTFFLQNVPPGFSSNTVYTKWDAILEQNSGALRALVAVAKARKLKPSAASAPISNRETASTSSAENDVIPIRPPEPTNRNSSANESEARVSAPWLIWLSFGEFFSELNNPATNPISSSPFGVSDRVLRLQGRQTLMWALSKTVRLGPAINFGLVNSPNETLWWNNHLLLGAALRLTLDIAQNPLGHGFISFELFSDSRKYFYRAPATYQGWDDKTIGARATIVFNGDWFR